MSEVEAVEWLMEKFEHDRHKLERGLPYFSIETLGVYTRPMISLHEDVDDESEPWRTASDAAAIWCAETNEPDDEKDRRWVRL